ncbi:MAG: hypothetical protein WC290_01740 [archaeon]|jgi:hypothetical protein
MTRRLQSPQLFQSKIKLGKVVGKGQITDLSKPVRKAIIIDKGHKFNAVRKNNTLVAVSEIKTKQNTWLVTLDKGIKGGPARRIRANSVNAWRTLKRAGLPVPSFLRVQLKKGSDYLATYMEDMRVKRGKLTDTHKKGKPVVLQELKTETDHELIKSLGRDLGVIYDNKLFCQNLDFWHFYNTNNKKRDRVILDFDSFERQAPTKYGLNQTAHFLLQNINSVKYNMQKKEFELFIKELSKSKFYKRYGKNLAKLSRLHELETTFNGAKN